jgi:hypothetical protein
MIEKNDMTVRVYIQSNPERREKSKAYIKQFLSDEFDKDNDLLLQEMAKDERNERGNE